MFRSLPGALALSVLALVTTPDARAGESPEHAADLRFGPVIGGLDVRLDLRTTATSAPFALFISPGGSPTAIGQMAPLGVDLSLPFVFFIGSTNSAGRFVATLPTSAGQFGPAGAGQTLFVQGIVIDVLGRKLQSNVEATEIEPAAPAAGYLADVAASHLPAGYDQLGGNALDTGDIDHDGHIDLLIATEFDVRLWMNDGTGVFADETAARLTWPGDAVATLRAGDIDRDGDTDILTGGGYDGAFSPPNRLWLNDGSGVYAESATFPAGDGLATQFEVADVSGDSYPDVLIANGSEAHLTIPGGPSILLISLGEGEFFESSEFTNAAWNDGVLATTTIRAGDVDDDGDLDLFVGRADSTSIVGGPGEPNLLLKNDGTGIFTNVSAAQLLPTLSDNTQDARFADLDGDMDLDIVVANSITGVSPANSGDVYINQGGKQGGTPGVFHDNPASFLEPWTFGDGIRLGTLTEDLDADGDIDVIVTIHDLFLGADQMLFLNQGGAQHGTEGAFVRQMWFDPPFSGTGGLGDFICWGSAAFDADHDGDKDVILCGNGVAVSPPTDEFTTRFLLNGKL